MKCFFTISFLLFYFLINAQTVRVFTSGTKTSIRGLSVVNNSVLWASGSNGTVVRSTNGGKTFDWLTVRGYEQRDFRDVEAFDSNTAVIMAVAEPAVILKTKDGGKNWQKVFEDSTKGMFLDAMDFVQGYGVVIGDPINNTMFMATTVDAGEHWRISTDSVHLSAGEAFFASSGTNIKLLPTKKSMFNYLTVSGGLESNFINRKKYKLTLLQGKESQGANSIAVYPLYKTIIVVGGDFANDKDATANCTISKDGGKYWQHPQTSPHGYRSCVEFINDKQLITCGTSGVDISNDGGLNWTLISTESYHVCQKAKNGSAVFLAGKDGRIAKLQW